MDVNAILAHVLPRDSTWGTLQGRIKPGPMTFLRVSTDDANGRITAYLGEGTSTDDPASTWGGIGVVRIPQLQKLLRHICLKDFEHHVAINMDHVADAIAEGIGTYLNWDIYHHQHHD
jgi:L-fucose isomerase-like protein